MRYTRCLTIAALAGLAWAAAPRVAGAQVPDPKAAAQDLEDTEIRLFDQYQRKGMTRWFFGRVKLKDDGSVWYDDKGQIQFDVDQRHKLMKNTPKILREKGSNIDVLKYRQLPHQKWWKLYKKRFPHPKKPDRGALAALAKEAIAEAQADPKEYWDLFLDEIRGGLLDTAAKIYEDVIQISPDWSAGYRDLGDLYRSRFDYEREMRTYLDARKAGAADAEVLRREAEALERLGLFGNAEGVFSQALTQAATDAPSNLGLGRVRLRTGRPDEALGPFQLASQGSVMVAAVALQGLGRSRLALATSPTQVDEAVAILRKAVDQAPGEAKGLDGGPLLKEIQHDLAVALLLQGKFAEAKDALLQVLELDEDPKPPAPPIVDEDGDGQPDEGAEPPKDEGPRLAQEFNPFLARAYTNLGVCYTRLNLAAMDTEQQASAKESLIRAGALDPTSAEPWIALGGFHESVKAWYDAQQAYARALEIDPTSAGARYAMGQLLYRAGRLDEAERELEQAIRFDPNLADALVLLGHIALQTQRDDSAARYFARAAEYLPEDDNLHASRGVALLRNGDINGAGAAFTAALNMNAENRTALEGQAFIEYVRARGKREREDGAVQLMQQLAAAGSAWAKQAQDDIFLQRDKHQWYDPFDRGNGKKVGNRWEHTLKNGPLVSLRDQRVVFSGPVKKNPIRHAVWMLRESDGDLLVSVGARLFVDSNAPFALRLLMVSRNKRDGSVQSGLYFGKNAKGRLEVGTYDSANRKWTVERELGEWPQPDEDGAVHLRVERRMESKRFTRNYRFWVNGEIVADDVEISSASLRRTVHVGVGAQGNLNVSIKAEVDDVRIVEKKSR